MRMLEKEGTTDLCSMEESSARAGKKNTGYRKDFSLYFFTKGYVSDEKEERKAKT